jgi:phosphoglycolate phosphatase-like HAD superfamily hydrolase
MIVLGANGCTDVPRGRVRQTARMNRDDLESALDRDGSPIARDALAQLQAGASFELLTEGRATCCAHRLWDCWSFRYETMLDMGVTPRPGLAEAVDRLKAAGTARVHLATVTGLRRRFTVFLAEDLTRCIACM